jgi:hypothetical protein
MRSAGSRPRVAAALAAILSAVALLVVVVAASAGAQAAPDPVVEQPFGADSGDACRYGSAKGVLGWHLGSLAGSPRVVDVTGVVVDRPVPTGPVAPCADDRRSSTMTLAAYAGGVLVDTQTVPVDNGTREFEFQLANTTSTARIERVTVQVCRPPLAGLPATYCGPTQEYRAPVT